MALVLVVEVNVEFAFCIAQIESISQKPLRPISLEGSDP